MYRAAGLRREKICSKSAQFVSEFVYDATIRHSNGLKGTAGLTDTADEVNEEIGKIRKRPRKQTPPCACWAQTKGGPAPRKTEANGQIKKLIELGGADGWVEMVIDPVWGQVQGAGG